MKIRKERAHFKKIKSVLKNYFSFYNKNLRKIHIATYIFSLIIFGICMITFINNLDEINRVMVEIGNGQTSSNIYMDIIKEKIPLTFLIIFSGITPFVFIPVLGVVGYPYMMAKSIMNMSAVNMLIASIGAVVQIFSLSLAISAGIYYCINSTKRFRYSQSSTFGLEDVKEQLYEVTKKEDKLKKIQQKKKSRLEKISKLNVKIEYKPLIITGIISSIITAVATLISGV